MSLLLPGTTYGPLQILIPSDNCNPNNQLVDKGMTSLISVLAKMR